MPIDHPDGTFPVALTMADIMMPVDIQAQYANLTVDIVAQTIGNLAIDIKAQTLSQLNVNIAASAITLNVSVTGTANISINAQTVGVSVQGEWQVEEGHWKAIYGSYDATADSTWRQLFTYTVPTGKTFYIYGVSGALYAYAASTKWGCNFRLIIAGTVYNYLGGQYGATTVLGAPFKAAASQNIGMDGIHFSDTDGHLRGAIWGYEV